MAYLFDLPVESEIAVVSRPSVKSENFINIDEILNTSGVPKVKPENGVSITPVAPIMSLHPPPSSLSMPPQMLNHMYQMMYMNMIKTQQNALAMNDKDKPKEKEKEPKSNNISST
jgi:hypothetical protein